MLFASSSGPIVTTTTTATEKHLDEANTTWHGPPCETIAWSLAVALFAAAAVMKFFGKGQQWQ